MEQEDELNQEDALQQEDEPRQEDEDSGCGSTLLLLVAFGLCLIPFVGIVMASVLVFAVVGGKALYLRVLEMERGKKSAPEGARTADHEAAPEPTAPTERVGFEDE